MPEPIDVAEALLFASETPVEADRIQEVLGLDSAGEARELVRELVARLDARGSALQIIELLRHTWSLLFTSVAGAERLRTEWVVTLLALLELVRLGQARVHQAELFGDIVIESGPHNEPAPEFSLGAAPDEAEPNPGDSAHA